MPATAPRILIVDDDQITLDTYARVLRLTNYDVVTAVSAEAGLHEVDLRRPDAILLDLRMPGSDGLEFLRRLRARGDTAKTPVAIVTGDYLLNDVTTPAQLAELGARVYFKPLWLEELSSAIQELLKTTGAGT
jgi:DNA-binding response OmpR family regulator